MLGTIVSFIIKMNRNKHTRMSFGGFAEAHERISLMKRTIKLFSDNYRTANYDEEREKVNDLLNGYLTSTCRNEEEVFESIELYKTLRGARW